MYNFGEVKSVQKSNGKYIRGDFRDSKLKINELARIKSHYRAIHSKCGSKGLYVFNPIGPEFKKHIFLKTKRKSHLFHNINVIYYI